jgi:hypothetical protein
MELLWSRACSNPQRAKAALSRGRSHFEIALCKAELFTEEMIRGRRNKSALKANVRLNLQRKHR